MKIEHYVSIDIETTGLDPSWCQVLEIGAVVCQVNFETPVEKLPTFCRRIDHGRFQGQSYALQMNHAILNRIATGDAVTPAQAVMDFHDFLSSYGVDPLAVVFAGKNAALFDLPFLKMLPGWNVRHKHRVIDPAILYWKPEVDGAVLPDMKTCMHRAGLSGEVAHTAVEDARTVIRLIRTAVKLGAA